MTSSDPSTPLDDLVDRAEAAGRAGEWDEAVAAWRAVLAHSGAEHSLLDYEILDEIHQLLRRAGRHDEAIAAKREAIAAGYRSSPDPEADIAEVLVAAGRRSEADMLYAELRRRDPGDVWLYNSAGFVYRGVDDREALRWCLDGIDVAIATGDPDHVVEQLVAMSRDLWAALDEPPDRALLDRVAAFMASWSPAARRRPRRAEPAVPAPAPAARTTSMPVALAWFPVDQWPLALDRWPDLTDGLPADHAAYSRRIEARLKWFAKGLPGTRVSVAPITVAELETAAGDRAGTAETRSALAARVHQQGRAVAWPPGRNDRCWCGSGRKYKQCCGPEPPAPEVGAE
jgi:tetratricopeptide (TPR) repeat protein